MFTYLDPAVRERLIKQGKLFRINTAGERVDMATPVANADTVINLLGPIPLPITLGPTQTTVQWYAAVRSTELGQVEQLASELRAQGGQHLFSFLVSSMAVNSVLVIGDPKPEPAPLVRIHSNCLTGDIFGSERCDCGPQLAAAVAQIDADPAGGYVIYMAGHEGRGIGLWAKAATYLLQDGGENTYQANRSLGLPDDSRDFSDAASLLLYFHGRSHLRVMTNNPNKLQALREGGLEDIEPVKHVAGVTTYNKNYLEAKREWGHALDPDDVSIK